MKQIAFAILLLSVPHVYGQQKSPEEKVVLYVVRHFFDALEKQDTSAMRVMFLEGARNFSVRETKDTLVLRGMLTSDFRFRPGQIIKERMREATTEVRIQGNIAMVWAPYDLWVNETFSHCGIDVFTLIKNSSGWKIASVSYTVEKEGCGGEGDRGDKG